MSHTIKKQSEGNVKSYHTNREKIKEVIRECIKEIISEDSVDEISSTRKREYPSAESNVFNAITKRIVSPDNFKKSQKSPDQKELKIYENDSVIVIVNETDDSHTLMSKDLIADKSEDGTLKYKRGSKGELKTLAQKVFSHSVNEINGTPEYSHENYGMLESTSSDNNVKYNVSYKLYDDMNRLIRVRKDVEIMGPDFSGRDEERKKYLEDKCLAMETAIRNQANKKNQEIQPITGNKVKNTGDVKIVGLIVNNVSAAPVASPKKSGEFDKETMDYLSRELKPGERVD